MNCPNCGAPTKSSTCEYCKTEQAPKPAHRTVINTGGGAFIGGMIKVGGSFVGGNSVTIVNGRPVKNDSSNAGSGDVNIDGDFVGGKVWRR